MAPAAESSQVAPGAGWRAALAKAAEDVFSMMVGVTVMPVEGPRPDFTPQVTGTVGIAGAFSAVFSLRCSTQTANSIASQMLGVSLEEANAQQNDAVGEICNIIAGDFKAKIGLSDQCMLSVPTVITGRDYQLRPAANSERVELQLTYGDEKIDVLLDVRR